jgi:hypothetical protein
VRRGQVADAAVQVQPELLAQHLLGRAQPVLFSFRAMLQGLAP